MHNFFIYLSPAVIIFTTILLLIKWKQSYWKRKGLAYIEPELFFGNVREQMTEVLSFGDQSEKIYKYFKSKGLKHGGYYMLFRPVYIPIDLDLIKNIMHKDFNHFMNHGILNVDEKKDPLTGNLFFLENEKWRNMTIRLTPAFTSGKIKMMFDTFLTCTTGLTDLLEKQSKLPGGVDIKDVVARFTTDIVGSVAFGIECNSLKYPESIFRQKGRRIFEMTTIEKIKNALIFVLPKIIVSTLRIKQLSQELEDFFIKIVKDTTEYRESMNVHRNDFIQLLLEIKNKGYPTEGSVNNITADRDVIENPLTINEMAAQCFVFFLAGFETSATTMAFALLELALNNEIQEKLREEINEVAEKHNGKITYETVAEMSYLDQVVYETLRKHPPISTIPRLCNKTYQVPDTSVVLEPGQFVQIPVQAIHRDPDYYPDPDRFDPDRFTTENKAKRPQYSFLTFGEGPRYCIGARFGILQTKVGLISIVKNFKVSVNEKTTLPIKYATERFITVVKGGVWLNLERIPDNIRFLNNHEK